MTRGDMWKEFEKELIREIRTSVTMRFYDDEILTKLGIEETIAKWRRRLEQTKWIPFTKRPMTDEEREYYREWSDIEDAMIFDCPLPEDGQEVLVSYNDCVYVDVFCKDYECYFEGVDIDDVDAWMPLPEPYKGERNEKTS